MRTSVLSILLLFRPIFGHFSKHGDHGSLVGRDFDDSLYLRDLEWALEAHDDEADEVMLHHEGVEENEGQGGELEERSIEHDVHANAGIRPTMARQPDQILPRSLPVLPRSAAAEARISPGTKWLLGGVTLGALAPTGIGIHQWRKAHEETKMHDARMADSKQKEKQLKDEMKAMQRQREAESPMMQKRSNLVERGFGTGMAGAAVAKHLGARFFGGGGYQKMAAAAEEHNAAAAAKAAATQRRRRIRNKVALGGVGFGTALVAGLGIQHGVRKHSERRKQQQMQDENSVDNRIAHQQQQLDKEKKHQGTMVGSAAAPAGAQKDRQPPAHGGPTDLARERSPEASREGPGAPSADQ